MNTTKIKHDWLISKGYQLNEIDGSYRYRDTMENDDGDRYYAEWVVGAYEFVQFDLEYLQSYHAYMLDMFEKGYMEPK